MPGLFRHFLHPRASWIPPDITHSSAHMTTPGCAAGRLLPLADKDPCGFSNSALRVPHLSLPSATLNLSFFLSFCLILIITVEIPGQLPPNPILTLRALPIMSLVHFIYDLTKRSLLCSFPLYNFTLCPLWGLSLFPFFMVTHKTLPCRFNKAYKQYLKTSPERQEPKDVNSHCHFTTAFS